MLNPKEIRTEIAKLVQEEYIPEEIEACLMEAVDASATGNNSLVVIIVTLIYITLELGKTNKQVEKLRRALNTATGEML